MYNTDFLEEIQDSLHKALPAWGVNPSTEVTLLNISENATFLAKNTGLDQDLVFRIHRPGYHSRQEIESELLWIDAIRKENKIRTPKIIPLKNGKLIGEIKHQNEVRYVVGFEFLDGEMPSESGDLVSQFRDLGGITAKLHSHTRSWLLPASFKRKVWNFDTTLGEIHLWGDFREGLGLTGHGKRLLEYTAEVLKRKLEPLSQPENFGLIHADLRLANLLVAGDDIQVIDFDDCGFSWFLYDFAAAVSFIEHEPYLPELQAAWVEGYRTQLPLSDEQVAHLPILVMLRRILLTAWIASHAETPTAQEMGESFTFRTLELAEQFLHQYT
ncbi:MAG: phosphotransferase [Synechococcaceae cyanobacterium SM2_3_1]|nr:phosphotransferase [Synechococcaceae cyanobacterium SM2_3_1]